MSPAIPPQGIVTFLFTDIENSTAMWEKHPQAMKASLARHDEILEQAVAYSGGFLVKTTGDGAVAAFAAPAAAVAAAAAAQIALQNEAWAETGPLRARMGLHTGEAEYRNHDYFGPTMNRAARVMGIGNGRQILLSAAAEQFAREHLPADYGLRDLGDHRLEGLATPERIFQLEGPGLPADFPPLRSLSAAPNNLPASLTPFIGRRPEMAAIKELLHANRLVTLVGPGGTGKSRLAIEVGGELTQEFAHGIFFCSLAPIAEPEHIAQAIAESIGLSLATSEAPQQQLIGYLRPKQLLLILDNFEHLIDGAGLVGALLAAARDVKILATSRVRLNLAGEALYNVPGLRVDAWDSPEAVRQNEAVQLFVSTARRVNPDFELSENTLTPLRHIVLQTGGLPLGILLAASWADMLPVPEIAAEIGRDVDFLATDAANMPERQRSMRAVFNYSWRLLNAQERALFATLSVFRGGFTRHVAAAVAGATLRQLANLAAKSFLSADPESGRYAVHELLRQYGEEILKEDADRYAATLAAHAAAFARLTAGAFASIQRGEQPEALATIEADMENVRAAWRYLVMLGEPAKAATMVGALWFVHEIRGWHVAGAEIFGAAVRAAANRPATESLRQVVALCQSAQSWFVTLLGNVDEGLELTRRGATTLLQFGAPGQLQLALGLQNLSHMMNNDMREALTSSLEMLAVNDSRWLTAWAYQWTASLYLPLENFTEARRYIGLGAKALEPISDHFVRYWLLLNSLLLAAHDEQQAQAQSLLEEALALVKEVDWRRGIQYVLLATGNMAMLQRDYVRAQMYYAQSLVVSEELASVREMVNALAHVADALAGLDQPIAALELAATAHAHPLSGQYALTSTQESIASQAETLKMALTQQVGAEAAEAAWERGRAADFNSVVASVLENAAGHDS